MRLKMYQNKVFFKSFYFISERQIFKIYDKVEPVLTKDSKYEIFYLRKGFKNQLIL